MSKYTTEVRFICETLAGETESTGYKDVNEVLNVATPLVFNFDFPIFDEAYRVGLEKKILKHFYTREIGFETVGLWKLKLETKMNEIMPYYNQLYESRLLQFDPLSNYKYHKTGSGEEEGSGEKEVTVNGSYGSETATENSGSDRNTTTDVFAETNSSTSDRDYKSDKDGLYWDKYSDTPQGGVNGLDSDTYLTNARKNTSDEGVVDNEQIDASGSVNRNDTITSSGTNSNTGSIEVSGTNQNVTNGTDSHTKEHSYIEDVIGYSGISSSKLIMEFREAMLNVDMMVIEELEELFFQLW